MFLQTQIIHAERYNVARLSLQAPCSYNNFVLSIYSPPLSSPQSGFKAHQLLLFQFQSVFLSVCLSELASHFNHKKMQKVQKLAEFHWTAVREKGKA